MQLKNLANTIKNIASGKRGVHFRDTDCAEKLIYPEEKFSMPELLDIEGQSHHFFEAYETTIPPFYVRSLRNGICYTSGEEVYTSDGRVILEQNTQKTAPPVRWRRFLDNVTRVRGKVVNLSLCGLENNYYHWLIECLGRLRLIHESGFRPDFYVVSNALGFQKRWLEQFGIQERQIIPANTGVSIQADELIVPSLLNNWEIVKFRGQPVYQKQWLPRWVCELYSKFRLEKGEGKERIYISRAKASHRRVVNENALLPLLEKYGFAIVHLENFPLQEEFETFANAKVVVGPHGAGLASCLFCPPNASVLEIYPQYHHEADYRVLFSTTTLRYSYMIGETSDTSCLPADEDVYVNPEKFDMALKTLTSR
jgi:hypothetical protein